MKVLIVGGANPKCWPANLFEEEYVAYIGVDRGALYLLEQGKSLDAAIGDFDSLSQEEYEKVKAKAKFLKQSPAEKDDTDTQLGLLYAIEHFPDVQYRLAGLTGGRLDHFLANFWMVLEPRFTPYARQIELVDAQNIIEYYLPGSYTIENKANKRYLAYVCMTPHSSKFRFIILYIYLCHFNIENRFNCIFHFCFVGFYIHFKSIFFFFLFHIP